MVQDPMSYSCCIFPCDEKLISIIYDTKNSCDLVQLNKYNVSGSVLSMVDMSECGLILTPLRPLKLPKKLLHTHLLVASHTRPVREGIEPATQECILDQESNLPHFGAWADALT